MQKSRLENLKGKEGLSPISVFDFTDYREFLKAYYQFEKSTNPAFSYRYFALRAKINSSGFYKNVIDGKKTLGRSLTTRFAAAMKLKKKEAEYFENMVFFNDAHTVEEKLIYFERMMSLRKLDAYLIQTHQFEYYSKWYYSAIRELIGFLKIKDDYVALSQTLNPPIRPDQAEKAIKVLLELKFISKDASGFYIQCQHHITTGPEVQSLNVAQYQLSCMDLAKEAFDRHKPTVRDMSTLTLSISEQAFPIFKEEIIAFRKKLLTLERQFPKPDRVYQLNTHFFPLSKISNKEKL